MNLIRKAGYATLFPSDIPPWLETATPTSKAVCLTFDDGYENFLTEAFPVLREFDFKSTVYIPTGLVGCTGPNGCKLLGWSQIRELAGAGVNFGSHTVTHQKMECLSDLEMRKELADSKNSLEGFLGREIWDFSHPYAFPEQDYSYTIRYLSQVKAAGYKTGMTTIIGSVKAGNEPLKMQRLPINDFDDHSLLAAKLNSSYDWLHRFQLLLKTLHS
jgi:peptidoglycan/xylan/chitin deacetylase (PgdA/CDA1 family)